MKELFAIMTELEQQSNKRVRDWHISNTLDADLFRLEDLEDRLDTLEEDWHLDNKDNIKINRWIVKKGKAKLHKRRDFLDNKQN